MNQSPRSQIRIAKQVLGLAATKPEDQVRKGIVSLLESLSVECEVSYRTDGGPADIYLPRRRVIVETKQVGLATNPERPQSRASRESPKQQLDRYLRAEIGYEVRALAVEEGVDKPWIGIVTDGKIWHVWRYAHVEEPIGTSVVRDFSPQTPEALITFLKQFVEIELIGKPWIPSNPRPLFEPRLDELREIYARLTGAAARRTKTKLELWLQMLRTSSMEPAGVMAQQRLFVAHSFLVLLARGVIHALSNPQTTPDVERLLADGFVSWVIDSHRGRQWASNLLIEICQYEWRRRPGDVLKPLYENFVDENDRKDFGEFYTPDWLAELLVNQVCDEKWCEEAVETAQSALRNSRDLKGVGVLDPTCGSGTFLYHAAIRLLSSPVLSDYTDANKAAVVCSLIHGIDVHPVAAEISRATLLRALPCNPPRGLADIQIHEGDALLVQGDEESSVFRVFDDSFWLQTPQGVDVLLPRSFVSRPDFSDDLRRLVAAASQGQALPKDIAEALPVAEREAIYECHQQFIEIVQQEGNSVWAWYIRNLAGPYRLSERKVDRVVANPPWVKMAKVQAQRRKRALEKFAQKPEVNLWSGGRQAPHFDIAQLFVKRVRNLYLTNPGENPGGWLVKKSALNAGSWKKFRLWHQSICTQTLDLEAVRPFGSGDARRCCVLFECRRSSLVDTSNSKLVATMTEGKSPLPYEPLSAVWDRLSFDVEEPEIPRVQSKYVDIKGHPLFRQGATVTPKVLAVVEQFDRLASERVHVVTARSQQQPWRQLDPQQGEFPSHWLRSLLVSKAVLPFSTFAGRPQYAIVPTDEKGNLSNQAASTSRSWQDFDLVYREYKGEGTHTPRSLIAQIDYGSKLSSQLTVSGKTRNMVVYPSSGDIMRACRVCPDNYLIDATLYYFVCKSVAEATYLIAILNAPCLVRAFARSRDSGRDFHLHPWRRVPIEKFDKTNANHTMLGKLAVNAERVVTQWLNERHESVGPGQEALSKMIRGLLADVGIAQQIDEIVREILPDQSS